MAQEKMEVEMNAEELLETRGRSFPGNKKGVQQLLETTLSIPVHWQFLA